LAEAHTALGGVLFFGDRSFLAAEGAFRRAIALNPNYPVAHEWLAVLLAELRRGDEALQHVDTAVMLSPLEGTMHQARGLVYYNAQRFEEAVRAERRALELTPQLPLARTLLVNALTLGGDPAGARAGAAPLLPYRKISISPSHVPSPPARRKTAQERGACAIRLPGSSRPPTLHSRRSMLRLVRIPRRSLDWNGWVRRGTCPQTSPSIRCSKASVGSPSGKA